MAKRLMPVRKDVSIPEKCMYCKYASDPRNYQMACEFYQYRVLASGECKFGKYEFDEEKYNNIEDIWAKLRKPRIPKFK